MVSSVFPARVVSIWRSLFEYAIIEAEPKAIELQLQYLGTCDCIWSDEEDVAAVLLGVSTLHSHTHCSDCCFYFFRQHWSGVDMFNNDTEVYVPPYEQFVPLLIFVVVYFLFVLTLFARHNRTKKKVKRTPNCCCCCCCCFFFVFFFFTFSSPESERILFLSCTFPLFLDT